MMTNDELKKKIISALQSVEFVTEKGWCGQCISLRLDYSAIADALIAAGIGDIREDEHRAARAERALRDELVQKTIRLGVTDICPWYIQALNEAEKELAEEGK